MSIKALVWGFYSQTPFTNYQKLQIQTLLQGESRKKTKKRTKSEKVKRVVGTVNKGENLNSAQVAKFHNLRNFAGCENFAILPNFTASLFLLIFAPLSSGF